MVGGRDFNESKFNRATQALRQVGSSFKPYVYTAAIDQGATPDDHDPRRAGHVSDCRLARTRRTITTASSKASITLRRALAQSRNIPALKLAESVGIKTVIDYARSFGITSNFPPYLPVALGAAEITLDRADRGL